ncbi:phosphoribosylaminoimidazolesuccinocarboxamide synthase [Candidatus Peregrinibacteria bacterium]|nr:MAG: phosphoribosylaminoimidazolesuccinocarboxamide synthase [Candidatus Peregrinibacteria bacterium]
MSISQEFLLEHANSTLSSLKISGYEKIASGKVREIYRHHNKNILITTDRQSAFDRILASIPFKGQVLNRLSAYWFEQTKDIISNHLLAVPDASVAVVRPVSIFPVEFVVRGYMTGSTDTSVWKNYEKGVREYCGNHLPEGMQKNEPFLEPIITPTTKSEKHDILISREEIIAQKLITAEEWEEVSQAAFALFTRGQKMVKEKGLLLVDTKFEFGRDKKTGEILLADEVLTPDSSRYWFAETYESCFFAGKEPESFDKEFLRLWFTERCDPYHDEILPEAPPELVVKLAKLYITAFEMITGENFTPEVGGSERIQKNLDEYFANAV